MPPSRGRRLEVLLAFLRIVGHPVTIEGLIHSGFQKKSKGVLYVAGRVPWSPADTQLFPSSFLSHQPEEGRLRGPSQPDLSCPLGGGKTRGSRLLPPP